MIAGGGADVIVDWMPSALAAREKGVPLVNIAQPFKRSGLKLTCRNDNRRAPSPPTSRARRSASGSSATSIPFLPGWRSSAFRTGGDHPGVNVLKQGFNVDPLHQKQADCISTMTYNEYWQVIDAGMKPEQLKVFKYEDEGVATLEDGLYATEAKLADAASADRLARFLRASAEGWRFAIAPEHAAETAAAVMGQAAPGRLEAAKERRMLGEVAKLVASGGHGIGYLDPAAYDRTVEVLLAGTVNPVIRRKPDGAWTRAVWAKAFAR